MGGVQRPPCILGLRLYSWFQIHNRWTRIRSRLWSKDPQPDPEIISRIRWPKIGYCDPVLGIQGFRILVSLGPWRNRIRIRASLPFSCTVLHGLWIREDYARIREESRIRIWPLRKNWIRFRPSKNNSTKTSVSGSATLPHTSQLILMPYPAPQPCPTHPGLF